MNTKNHAPLLMLFPGVAFAHASGEVYGLFIWYFILCIVIFGYIVMPRQPWSRKAITVGCIAIVTVVGWSLIGTKSSTELNMPGDLVVVILGVFPLLGYFIGQFITRKKYAI